MYIHTERQRYTHTKTLTYIQTDTQRETADTYSRGTHMYTEGRRERESSQSGGEIFKVMFKASLGTRHPRPCSAHTHTHFTLYCSFLSPPRDKLPRQELTSGMLLEGQTLG